MSAGEYLRPHPRFQVGRSGSINEAGRTHGTPRCRPPAPAHCGNRRIPPFSCTRRFKLPQPDCIASSVDVGITRCAQIDRNVHRCICIATTRPGHLRCDGSEHPPDWRAYVAVNGHVRVLLPTPTLVPLIAQRVANTAASSSRVAHMNEHGHTRGRLEQPFAPRSRCDRRD